MTAVLLVNDEILSAGECHPIVRIEPTWPGSIPASHHAAEFWLLLPKVPGGQGWREFSDISFARRARRLAAKAMKLQAVSA